MEPNREVLDRVRRIETRLTKIGDHMGVDTGGGKPFWNAAQKRVIIPTPNCSMGDILRAVPDELKGEEIDVFVHGEYLLTLFVDP